MSEFNNGSQRLVSEQDSKKWYQAPQLSVYGGLPEITAAVKNHGATDGGAINKGHDRTH